MGDEDGGDFQLLLQGPDIVPQLNAQTGIQVGKGLVQQQDLGLLDQGPGNGHPLLLTAGELTGLAVEQLCDLQHLGDILQPLTALCLGYTVHFQGEQNVVLNGHVGVQGVVLEYHADIPVFRRHIGHRLAVKKNLPLGRLFQTCHHRQCGTLAATGGAQQADHLTVLYGKGQMIHCCGVFECFCNIFQANPQDYPLLIEEKICTFFIFSKIF